MKDADISQIQASSNSESKILWDLWCRFYPLAITDFAMTLGDMLRPIALSRLSNAELSLAAIGIVKSIAVFLESPIIMILHASTALSRNRDSHRALWTFTLLMAGILTSVFLVLCFQPLYDWLFLSVFGVSQQISHMARLSFFLMIPWPALIAIRRFYQGLLVRDREEKSMANAGILRLIFTIAVLWGGAKLEIEGTLVAALSLIGAVAIEAIAVVYFSRRSAVKNLTMQAAAKSALPTNLSGVARYYAPLGATALIVWAARAALIAIIARAPDGILGIAVWTAASGFILPIANATRMVQQIVISSPNYISRKILMKFSCILGIGCCLPVVLLSFTAKGGDLLFALLGDSSVIAVPSLVVVQILIILPLLTALQNTYQGFLILLGLHWWINFSTIINVMLSFSLATLLINLNYSGGTAAAVAIVGGLSIEVLILAIRNRIK